MAKKKELTSLDVADAWPRLSAAERAWRLKQLPPDLAPDDIADVIQAAPADQRGGLLALLDETTRAEVTALLRQAQQRSGRDTPTCAYILDAEGKLLGQVSLTDLIAGDPATSVAELMHSDVITLPEEADQEDVAHLRLRDWWRVLRREVGVGLALGCVLAGIGFLRILAWQAASGLYGPHYVAIAITVAVSLVGIVMWATISGAMLPFILRRLGFDPASASAPFVATLVDVSGIVIYFSVASVVLVGRLL